MLSDNLTQHQYHLHTLKQFDFGFPCSCRVDFRIQCDAIPTFLPVIPCQVLYA